MPNFQVFPPKLKFATDPPFVMKEIEAFDPIDIGSFCANAVMFEANGVSYEIEEFRLVVHPCATV